MKKHLIALAVAGAVAAPVMAQNVSISGVVDQAVGRDTPAAAGSRTVNLSGVLTTSKLQFNATEDLGGGMKASIILADEFGLSSTGQGVTAAAGLGTTFDAASVSLSGNFGTVAIGRFGSLARNAGGAGSLAELGNAGLAGSSDVLDAAYGTDGANGSMRAMGDKDDNAFAYTTPTINGVTVQFWRAGANSTTGTGVGVAGDQTAIGATYSNGPLMVGVGTIKAKQVGSNAKTTAYAGSYDLGMAKVGLINIKIDENTSSAGDTRSVTVFNGAVPLGNGLTLIGAYHTFSQDEDPTANNASAMVVGVTKALSKRTTVYGVYGATNNETNAGYNLGMNDSHATTVRGSDPKTYAIGIRHVF